MTTRQPVLSKIEGQGGNSYSMRKDMFFKQKTSYSNFLGREVFCLINNN